VEPLPVGLFQSGDFLFFIPFLLFYIFPLTTLLSSLLNCQNGGICPFEEPDSAPVLLEQAS
jgi:hypothetical protein